ncbi:MAG: glutathione S-transferase N-terminal domain-containing protein [Gammaproteobacteria bacterium]
MDPAASRRATLTLFSRATCPYSHRVRMVLAEKGIHCEIIDVTGDDIPEDLAELNPYGTVPTLADRGLVLYDSRVIAEYLDERFPHPPLMAVDPVARAHARMTCYRMEQDWFALVPQLDGRAQGAAEKARKRLRESLVASSELFTAKPFFLSEEFSLVDCTVLPILWRLERWGIQLPAAAERSIARYTDRMFRRESFRASMTELEREMRA